MPLFAFYIRSSAALSLCLIFIIYFASSLAVYASENDNNISLAQRDLSDEITKLSLSVENIALSLQKTSLADLELSEISKEVNEYKLKGQEIRSSLMNTIATMEKQLMALSDEEVSNLSSDESSSEEVPSAAPQDSDFTKRLDLLQEHLKQVNTVLLTLGSYENDISTRRFSLFKSELFSQNSNWISKALWLNFIKDELFFWQGLKTISLSWISLLFSFSFFEILPILILLSFGFYFSYMARKALLKLRENNQARFEAEELRFTKAYITFLTSLANLVIPMTVLSLAYLGLMSLGAIPDNILPVLKNIAEAILIYAYGVGIISSMLSPLSQSLRYIRVSDKTAKMLSFVFKLIIGVYAIATIIPSLDRILAISVEHTIMYEAFASLVILSVILFAFWYSIKSSPNSVGLEEKSEKITVKEVGLLWPFAAIAASVGILSLLLGYVAFSFFITIQLVWICLILYSIRLFQILICEGIELQFSQPNTALQKSMMQYGLTQKMLKQLGLALSALMKLTLIALGLYLMFNPWGTRNPGVLELVPERFWTLDLGLSNISAINILIGLFLFLMGVGITRASRSWFAEKFLPETNFSNGVQNSLSVGIGYVGFILTTIIAFSTAGLSLENVAIIAGALSVGIGFGLQAIVSNFISGVILLAERPISVGDWIEVDGHEGYVRKISVRSTEIETFERSTVIVPNSNFISNIVTNKMHDNKMGRMVIQIGVSYDSDVEEVRRLLIEAANEHEKVLSFPAPNAYFMGFGDNSLDFLLYGYFEDVNDAFRAKSDTHFIILKKFREAGIEIPFPQRDVHVRYPDKDA